MRDQITPLILTYDEAPNLRRTLGKLAWARRIVVVDSGSTDGTREIAQSFPQVQLIERPFDDFASQCNFGLTQIATPWVLSLDADYELSHALVAELIALRPEPYICGYRARFIYRIGGASLRGSLYPPRTVLYRRDRARYRREGHGHRVEVAGTVAALGGAIYHDDRKPLTRWLASQRTYARDEAEHLSTLPRDQLGRADKIRLMAWPAPIAVFFYVLLVKRCLFDGWPGWYYAFQRTLAELLLALELIDRHLRDRAGSAAP